MSVCPLMIPFILVYVCMHYLCMSVCVLLFRISPLTGAQISLRVWVQRQVPTAVPSLASQACKVCLFSLISARIHLLERSFCLNLPGTILLELVLVCTHRIQIVVQFLAMHPYQLLLNLNLERNSFFMSNS